MLRQIKITYINFKTLKEYLRELERAQTDEQTKCINTFQLCLEIENKTPHSKTTDKY